MSTTLPILKLSDLLHYGEQAHHIYTLDGVEYVSMRPLIDQIGIDWRTQKKALLEDENLNNYGVLALEGSEIVQTSSNKTPKTGDFPRLASEKGQKIGILCTEFAQKDTLLMPLKRVYMYLIRINLGQIRSQGNIDAADYLRAKQEEWAEALSDYETKGIAIKRNLFSERDSQEKSLMRMVATVRTKGKMESQGDRKVLDQVMLMLGKNCGIDVQMDWVDENVLGQ